MNDRTPVDPDLKTFFELTVLKQLFEDIFFSFVNGKPGTKTAVELAEIAFSIAHEQGYTDFSVVYRSQLVNALEEVVISYRDICNKYSVLANRFPDVKFSIIDGWRRYRIFNDGLMGNVLRINTEVRMAHGRTALEMFNEDIIKATVYLVDRYNYNYRTDQLEEWNIQNNLVIWKDIIQGNGFLNFILTKARTIMTPMRVVVSTSTRPMVKPIPPPPTPTPWPGPQPWPVPPGPFPPGPGPVPPGPGPYPPVPPAPPPGPGPFPPVPPHPAPGPFPPPGPQPSPIYPPCPPPPPAPVPFWPPPPPPPPVIADCALVRRVVAERTVGGIKKDSVLPAGLTFTVFVEWLLRGDPQPIEDLDPSGILALNTDVPVGAPYVAELNFTITDLGTSLPHTVCFYERDVLLSGAASPRDGEDEVQPGDRLIGTKDYVNGQTNYSITLDALPDRPVVYYVAMDYKQQYSGENKEYESNKVPWQPPAPDDLLYFAAVPLHYEPTESDVLAMESFNLSSSEVSAALAGSGYNFTIPTDYTYDQTCFVALPTSRVPTLSWWSADGALAQEPPPDEQGNGGFRTAIVINGVRYTAITWEPTPDYGFGGPCSFKLKNK